MGRLVGNTDWLIVLLVSLLGTFGLFILLTIDAALFRQQLMFMVIGIMLLILGSRLDRILVLWSAPFLYVSGIILLSVTYLMPAIRGAKRWITVFGVQLQPSELVKPLMMVAYAWVITRYSPRQVKYIPLHIALFLVPFLLVFKQPDLGTSIVYASFWFAMMLAGGLDLRLVIITILSTFFIAPWAWGHLAEYQKNRLLTFVDPALDPKGAGYNALQATIAVGSGQLFGKGLGLGTQSHLRFLPEYHTDFIFATLIEELGFIGGIILLAVYAVLLWRVLSLMWKRTDDAASFVFGMGLFSMILAQIFINAGMNMGILPITGITLPFISYGGSSLLSLMFALGLMQALIKRKEEIASVAIT